jgi:assimilatory nitrate reductase catalytic subunit
MPCPTQDGKAKLLPLDWKSLSESVCEAFPLILNTGRNVEQFHTRTKTGTIGILEDLAPEAWIELNSADAKKLKVKSGDRITISGDRGKVEDVIVKVTQTNREGTCFVPFHFREQLINAITLPEFDEKSFEPNYKQCAVQLHSSAVPEGIKMEQQEISGILEMQKDSIKVEDSVNVKKALEESLKL